MGRAYLSVVLAVGETARSRVCTRQSLPARDVVNWIALVVGIVGVTVAPLGRQWGSGYLKTWRRDAGGPMWFLLLHWLCWPP